MTSYEHVWFYWSVVFLIPWLCLARGVPVASSSAPFRAEVIGEEDV